MLIWIVRLDLKFVKMSVTFPCIQCFKQCSEPCIQCSKCERWVHITCVPMTDKQLKTWGNHLLEFYCQQCCFSGLEFDSIQSLERCVTLFLFIVSWYFGGRSR